MRPEEKKCIRRWNDALPSNVELQLITTEDQRSGQFEDFCEELAGLAPRVRVIKEEGNHKELPALGIGPRLNYHAIPLGEELDPFLAALSLASGQAQMSTTVRKAVETLEMPALLRLFVTQQCPFCPVTVKYLLPLQEASALVHLVIIDGTFFPEIARQHHVRSAPTVLLDEQFRWTGAIPLEELVQTVAQRDPASLGPQSLESMLKEGHAFQVAEMMLERGQIFPAFFDLLVHNKMFVRLGAMVVMETIAAQDLSLAGQVVDPLWDRFSDVPDQVKGDIIHVIGESGDKKTVQRLKAVFNGRFSQDIKDAAKEALQRLQSACGSDVAQRQVRKLNKSTTA